MRTTLVAALSLPSLNDGFISYEQLSSPKTHLRRRYLLLFVFGRVVFPLQPDSGSASQG